jgi:exosortase
LPIALFAVLWADLVRQLSYTWEANEQYAYGWFVPFFALALFWKRWWIRPTAQPQTSPCWLTVLMVVAVAGLLPLRVVYEINPDWPLCSWVMALIVVGISLYAVFLAGGFKWVWHFAFPVCFILVAVQWPYRIEHGLTQGLMRVVAALTVEVLGWFDIPAFQHGNLIEISNGVVGISDACSGIRSFQATLMAALFLGELYQLRWTRRLLLLGGGVVIAFGLNVARTTTLTWHASSAGMAALEKWHDPAGLLIFIVSFACLWAIAVWLRAKAALVPPPGDPQPSTCAPQPAAHLPRALLIAVGCWAIVSLVATEVWYRSHEIKNMGDFHWSVVLPENDPTFQKIDMAPRTLHLLAFDFGATGQWRQEDGSQWTLYFFRWLPRSIGSVIMSRIHRPDVCLPASGLDQVSDSGIKYFAAGGLKLPFRRYAYEEDGKPLFVFFCQWEDGSEKQMGLQGSKQTDRLRSVLVGRRIVGNQSLELLVAGYATLEEADRAIAQRLPAMIHVDK